MKLQNTYDVGIYCRLSRDDNNGNLESMSIANQRQMLTDYVKEKGWCLCEIYLDDGYSGTNFDRPDFKRMLRDIENGKIDCVITKDLSRLGRNYSKVGYYTEEYFVDHDIRYIAVNDGFDSLREEENEIAPFKNVLNEWYPRDMLSITSATTTPSNSSDSVPVIPSSSFALLSISVSIAILLHCRQQKCCTFCIVFAPRQINTKFLRFLLQLRLFYCKKWIFLHFLRGWNFSIKLKAKACKALQLSQNRHILYLGRALLESHAKVMNKQLWMFFARYFHFSSLLKKPLRW